MSGDPATYDILLVDDDPATIAALGKILRDFGRVRFARTGEAGLRLARGHPPDLMLLDIELPDIHGFEVFSKLKADPAFMELPVLFIASHEDEEYEVKGLALGAADFINKPPRAGQIAARVRLQQRLQQMALALREAAATDPLTGLANRRKFDDALEREWLRSRRTGLPISLLMLDVDHFKAYNDHYGHPGGDRCLRTLADILAGVARRPGDLVARLGGEEFGIMLPETGAQGACCVARFALQALESARLPHLRSGIAEYVTVSVGASSSESRTKGSPPSAQEPAPGELVEAADRALYACKRTGRNHARFLSIDRRESPDRALDVREWSSRRPTATDEYRPLT